MYKPKYSQESEMLRSRVCSYLKQKILNEERETAQYHSLENAMRKLTNGHTFLDVLFDAQNEEIRQLKQAYRDMCQEGNKL